MLHNGNLAISWDSFYSPEQFLLPLLLAYSRNHEIDLKICGCSTDNIKGEANYFQSLLRSGNWTFIPRIDSHNSYEVIERYEFIVFIDTTLGYESLARGKKTAAFSVRGALINSPGHDFGWPANIPKHGPFWTCDKNEMEFERIMNYMLTVNDNEWEGTRKEYISQLIEYDPGNTKFLKLMKELQIPLTKVSKTL